MHLGPFELDHPFILAPMAGITNSPFRRLMRRYQSAAVVSELVSATGLHYESSRTKDLLKFDEEERPVGLQIFGEDPEHLNQAAKYVQSIGADFVDLNMGCPVPKVVKRGAGSAMCRDTVALRKILEGLVQSVTIPVTIKIRTGWDDSSKNALDVIQVAHDAGVRWVAIHGRTRAQGYSGQADWDFIAELKSKSPLPIIGNGDIQTPEQAVARVRESQVDAVMIGRGALRNPFIFRQAAELLKTGSYSLPSPQDYLDIIRTQRDLLVDEYTDRGAQIHARKFLAWFSAGFPGCHEFRRKVFTLEDAGELWKEAEDFFFQGALKRDTHFLAQPFLMGGHG